MSLYDFITGYFEKAAKRCGRNERAKITFACCSRKTIHYSRENLDDTVLGRNNSFVHTCNDF